LEGGLVTTVEQSLEQFPRIDGLLEVLTKNPMSVDQLVERLVAHGTDTTPEALGQELRARCDVVETAGGWVNLVAASEGVVLTHVLTTEERELGVLAADGDLDLWAMLADEGLALASGGHVRTVWHLGSSPLPAGAATGLAGPEGWLDGFVSGRMLALRMVDSTLVVESLVEDELDQDDHGRRVELCAFVSRKAADALDEYLADVERELDVSAWELLDTVVAQVVVEQPHLLSTPLPPLGRVLQDEGLQLQRGFVALAGVPPLSLEDDYEPAEIQALVRSHMLLGLVRCAAPPAELLRNLIRTLEVPVVHERLVDSVEAEPLDPPTVDALLAAADSDTERGHALLLAAYSAEGRHDYATAERRFDEASRLLPNCWPVIREAVSYAAARGDARRADGLLKAAGVPPDDPTRRALSPLLQPPDGVVSRNRPCPCGSGRKYKGCCLRMVRHSLPMRAPLVYGRLFLHSQRPRVIKEWSSILHRLEPSALALAPDLAMFHGGVAEDYLSCRGHLLPDDERDLIESWMATPLAPYEVDDVQVGRFVTLRPLLGGDLVVLRDRAFSTSVRPLDLLVARPLFDGREAALLSLPVYVHRIRRAQLLRLFEDGEYDVEAVVSFFGPQPAPKLRNRDGEDLVFCKAVYRMSAEEEPGAWERLHEHLAVDDDADCRLVLVGRRVTGDEHLLRGSVARRGGEWTVETNSLERFEELRKLVLAVAPKAVLVSESIQPANEAMDEHGDESSERSGDEPAGPSTELDLTPQQEAALLDEYIKSYEQGWVEEPIPALGDRSPREAVEVGGRALADLEAILDDTEWMHRQNGGGMDAARLRRLLGLPARVRN
jgi:SEC-C motif